MKEQRTVKIERTYDAAPAEVWQLWSTIDGIESWWGPDGFGVEVHEMDLVPGGKIRYSMIARANEMSAFMETEGMPLSTAQDFDFVEIVPYRRLAYTNVVDFLPGVETYEVDTRVDLEPVAEGTRLGVTLDVMHSDERTERAADGWRQELDKLARVVEEATR